MNSNRLRVLLVSMLAVFALSAVASSTASAALKNEYFVEKVAVAANETIEGSVGVAKLNSELAGVKILIECKQNILVSGEIEAAGASKGESPLANVNFSKSKLVSSFG